MALKFVGQMLGYDGNGKPNIADGSQRQSRSIAEAVLNGVGSTHLAPGGQQGRKALEQGVEALLASGLPALDAHRPWEVARGGTISAFRQYAHLARLNKLVESNPTLRVEIGTDYMISPDVTVSFQTGNLAAQGTAGSEPLLHAAVSCKFTIRSDRVQNIRHESIVMIRHRRGRQPHLVTVTAEPLPSRLAAICRGTGEVDAVYHVCLSELNAAVTSVGNTEQKAVLDEIIGQARLFDLQDLPDHLVV